MGHTNSTANIALPQFIGTDKPTWLGDVNGAFSAIDSKIGTIDADIAATDAKADNAVADAASAVTTANAANNTAGNASTTATNALNIANNALTVANNADGHTNQLETKVGLLADLHTTDKTSIVNAINETFDALPSGGSISVTADGVKTASALLDDLFALIDASKINAKSVLMYGINPYQINAISAGGYEFTMTICTASNTLVESLYAQTSGSTYYRSNNGTITNLSSTVPTASTVIELIY